MSDYTRAIADRLRGLPVREPPPPWNRPAVHAIGGLCAVGFSADASKLLVVSHQGRGVFDCMAGKRVGRDDQAYAGSETDPLLWQGIEPIAGEVVRTAGIWGGGLHSVTPDGWSLAVIWFDWPDATVLLQPPHRHYAMPEHGDVYKLPQVDSLVAVGFSPDGVTLVIAEGHSLIIYTRPPGR